MKTIELTLTCCMCPAVHRVKVKVPDGWSTDEVESRDGFCPEHAPIDEFKIFQCAGCVAGWGECPLWKGFAFTRYNHTLGDILTEVDLQTIERGFCPRRINGTTSFDTGTNVMSELDLSDQAPIESGKALVSAIRAYWVAYPECSPDYTPPAPKRHF